VKAKIIILAATVLLGGFSHPAAACRPFGSYEFAEDKDGGIWFTEGDNNSVSRLAPDGTVTAHKLPTSAAEPSSVALDAKGNVWFVESDAARIGRLGKDGRIVEFSVPDGHPVAVKVDARGDAWFNQMAGNENGREHSAHASHGGHNIAKIGRIDAKDIMHSYPAPEGWPTSIEFDKHDEAWVTLLIPGGKEGKPEGRLTRLSRSGQWTVVAAWTNSCPSRIVRDAGGELAFSDHCRGILGRVSSAGRIVEQRLPEKTYIQDIASAPDGTLWFTGDEKSRLGRIDRRGKVTYLDRPDNGDQTMAVLVTRKGDVVFSEFYNYNINRLTKNGEYVEHLVNVDERKGMREVKENEVCYVQFAARIAAKAEMDAKRAEEVRNGRFKLDGNGTEKLVEQKCLVCHDSRRLLLSRRSDWTPSLTRMHSYRDLRGVEQLTAEETTRLVRYFNENYGLGR
jgi:virginiamycin B lyase